MSDRIEAESFTRTLTGFDEIGIKRVFGSALGELEGGLVPRALLWVAERRDGMNDTDAFRKVMELPLGEVELRFVDTSEVDAGKAPTTGTTPTATSS
jgi:hypothetical protein